MAEQLYSGCVSHAAGGPSCLCLPPPHYLSAHRTSHPVLLAVMHTHPLNPTAALLSLSFLLIKGLLVSFLFFLILLKHPLTLLLRIC